MEVLMVFPATLLVVGSLLIFLSFKFESDSYGKFFLWFGLLLAFSAIIETGIMNPEDVSVECSENCTVFTANGTCSYYDSNCTVNAPWLAAISEVHVQLFGLLFGSVLFLLIIIYVFDFLDWSFEWWDGRPKLKKGRGNI